MMNNKKLPIIIAASAILLIIVIGIFFLFTKSKPNTNELDENITESIGTLTPQEIGLSLVTSSENKRVKVIIEKVKDIKSLEYDISYDADIPASELAPGEESGKVERGFSDEAIMKVGQLKYESKDFDLGSCSRNVCRYDTGVNEVRIVMKVVKKDNKIFEVKDSIQF